ncbi:MAG: hypothetical protein GDA46_06375 [Bdellovibrionales bacterium]|nr:hypothetical protein [Bdellovibrionales bacterium]
MGTFVLNQIPIQEINVTYTRSGHEEILPEKEKMRFKITSLIHQLKVS